jgi:cytoplasmic iron level regulating protein YaaA (DUF328/UPF0246 family)
MLFLLPPSETKLPGGGSLTIDQVALTFGGLNKARETPMEAAGAQNLLSAPTMRALDRYTGTLYGALHGRGLKGTPTENNSLTSDEVARAKSTVLIQSAMFGLIPSTDLIPEYKINATKKLHGVNLKQLWSQAHEGIWPRLSGGIIIDLRSNTYADLAPIPEGLTSYKVTVYVEREDGSREQLNHFNKKAKGQLVRAALMAKTPPETIRDLQKNAAKAGLKVEVSGSMLTVVTRSAT